MRVDGFLCDRLLKFPLPRRVSTVMLSVTLLGLIFSLPRSLKILCPRPTTVMCVPVHIFSTYVISFLESTLLELFLFWNFVCLFYYSRFPMWIVLITSWLIFLRMDLWVFISVETSFDSPLTKKFGFAKFFISCFFR